jgi:hypothetical protein
MSILREVIEVDWMEYRETERHHVTFNCSISETEYLSALSEPRVCPSRGLLRFDTL